MTDSVNFESLNLLLKASSKEFVVRICEQAFLYRDLIHPPPEVIHKLADELTVEDKEAQQLLSSLSSLIRHVLFIGCSDAAAVHKVFPDSFHKDLRTLLSRTLGASLSTWRNRSINSQVSLPRLVDFDWRVDIKTSSDTLARMSMPTCVLQLKVQDNATSTENVPAVNCMNVELGKETLETMLDGLGKIRDQLNSVAKK
ncbi:COMM domain-containing protein 9-like [Amphiura filiformis]|uniref:COMM domain-containing protein 9-like n=1 Tax=Amphiura filiformis TaxID=82378 RepID=UPI003B2133FD